MTAYDDTPREAMDPDAIRAQLDERDEIALRFAQACYGGVWASEIANPAPSRIALSAYDMADAFIEERDKQRERAAAGRGV